LQDEKLKGKFDYSVSLLCWAYNEELNIYEYLEKAASLLNSAVNDYEIVLIDDGSTDGTFDIAAKFQKTNPRLNIFKNERNLNVGVSIPRAISLASKDYLFWQTVDWSYDISNLRRFLEYLREYDVVQGVRRRPVAVKAETLKPIAGLMKLLGMKHLTKRSDTVRKAVISVVNYVVIRTLFRVPVSDFQNVTFYPTKWLQTITHEAKSAFANPECLIKAYWQGKSIKEVPISFIPRSKGKGRGTRYTAVFSAIKDILRLWFVWVVLGKRGVVTKGKVYRLAPKESQV
jgi:glycosyltransferase involved in cell wall biosynthesis